MDPEVRKKLQRLSSLEKRLAQLKQRRARQRIEREIEQLLGVEPDRRGLAHCRRDGCDFESWGLGLAEHYQETGH
jgi:hypothetical protein